MKKLITFLIICLGWQIIQAQSVVPVKNGDLYSLQVANLYFEVDASFGGQISSLGVDDHEILFFSGTPGDYLIGSTLWPSPQSVWNWPPSAELDRNPYEAEIIGNSIVMESSMDPASKLVFKKTFTASEADTSVTLLYEVRNGGTSAHSVAAWEVTRVPSAGSLSFYPAGETGPTGELASSTQLIDDIVWYQQNGSNPTGKKFIGDGSEGWFAHVSQDQFILIKEFADVAADDQAPGEGEIELYYKNGSTYIELENQSAYVTLQPGEKFEYPVTWYARTLPASIEISAGNPLLTEYVNHVLSGFTSARESERSLAPTRLYPNPASEKLQFRTSRDERSDVTIYDITEKMVLFCRDIENGMWLDITGLSEGIYVYTVLSGSLLETGKLVISHSF